MSNKAALKRHAKAADKAQKHLHAASEALYEMLRESLNAGLYVKGADDGRRLLAENCTEYANHLEMTKHTRG
jgi:hypothetical protein